MQRVAVLIDFTEGSVIALKQAEQLATKTNAELHAVHICSGNDKVEASTSELRGFVSANSDSPHNIKCDVGVGTVLQATPDIMRRITPDVIVVCTHGVKGLIQHLFGAKIIKLAQAMRYPVIVVQENNKVNLGKVKSILFPLGPHTAFNSKIVQTGLIAKALGASIVMYEIDTPGSSADSIMEKNKKAASAHFKEMNLDARYVLDEMRYLSAGFSRQTIAYAAENHFELISLMTTVSINDTRFGDGDKESLVINTAGIPVLLSPE